jgi:hypothetical protein
MRSPEQHGPSPANADVGDLSRCRGRGATAAAAAREKAAFTQPKETVAHPDLLPGGRGEQLSRPPWGECWPPLAAVAAV